MKNTPISQRTNFKKNSRPEKPNYERFSLPKTKLFDVSIDSTIENLKKVIQKLLSAPHNMSLDLDSFTDCVEHGTFHKHVLLIGGSQISGSLSPFMHTYSGFLTHSPLLYTLVDISQESSEVLDDLLYEIEDNPYILGANVTMPYKIKVYEKLKALGQLDDSALLVGAVNTISKQNGKMTGFNTDMEGVLGPIQTTLGGKVSQIQHAYILGAGGASKAVIAGLLKLGVSNIHIFNRTPSHLLELSNHFHSPEVKRILGKDQKENFSLHLYEYDIGREESYDLSQVITQKGILVNTLPFGFKDCVPKYPIRKEILQSIKGELALYFDIVYDLNYPCTPMMSLIQSFGTIPTCDGRDMVIGQAKKGFELWTGAEFDTEVISGILR